MSGAARAAWADWTRATFEEGREKLVDGLRKAVLPE